MMVTRWGFSPELGAVSYGENQDEVFRGLSVARQQQVPESTGQKANAGVTRPVEEGPTQAHRVHEATRADPAGLAQGLRTADIYEAGTQKVSTEDMGNAVVKALG